jgi:hypothetical protein
MKFSQALFFYNQKGREFNPHGPVLCLAGVYVYNSSPVLASQQ